MSEGRVEEEILSLLTFHDLKKQVDLFKSNPDDLNNRSHVLLTAYIITNNSRFFDLLYSHTYKLFITYATNLQKRFSTSIDPVDVVSDTYMLLLNRCSNSNLSALTNLVGYAHCLIRNIVYKSCKRSGIVLISHGEEEGTPSCSNPLDILIIREENKKKELRKAWIYNLLDSELEGISDNHRDILKDYYYNKITVKEIAKRNDTSASNIYNILYKSTIAIKRMMMKSNHSLSDREELT